MEDKPGKKRERPDSNDDDEDIEMDEQQNVEGEDNLYEKEDSYESVEDNEEEDEEFDAKDKIKIKNEAKKEKKNEDKNNIQVNLWDEKKNKNLKDGEVLDFDNDAYEMLHRSKVEWPCLSVDFLLKENSSISSLKEFYLPNDKRKMTEDKYPYNTYIIAGSQTDEKNGYFYFMRWYNMRKTKYDDDPDKGEDDDEEEEDKINPFMKYEKIKVNGNINRVKSMKNSSICALWNDSPSVDIIDCEELFNNIEYQEEIRVEEDIDINKKNKNKKPKKDIKYKKIFKKTLPQKAEGFAIDWNNINPFVLALGGYDKKVSIFKPKDENVSDIVLYGDYLTGHADSVEDIQWSPNEENVLASCGIDKSIRFWDIRENSKNPPKIIKNAHNSDVNVISWNSIRNHLFASGGDDNTFKVWDLRYLDEPPITEIKWHTGPINSIMWDPFDESQLAVCSEDNRLSVWDFSVEPDEKKLFDNYNHEIPQQLVFLHQGQINLKDVKFHPVFKNMLISSAENGLNLFRPNFTDEASEDDEDEKMDEEDDKVEDKKENDQ
jgi:ribosome assembly protein RRB1